MTGKFTRNTKYYSGVVYEWNLPTGWTCPFAKECLVKVDRQTGKFQNDSGEYRCYAANAERFPSARNSRWSNFDMTKQGSPPVPPSGARHIRIHASGDFYSQAYFDMWLEVCRSNPDVEFWAYTKSINYWVSRLDSIPPNLELTASYGGKQDKLIEEYKLKNTKVYSSLDKVPDGMPIDTNDDCARNKTIREFALLDNFVIRKKKFAVNKIKIILENTIGE
jgi:hypothetical protein